MALVLSSGAELGIAGTADGEVACPPDGDATALVATLGAEDAAGEALRLRLRALAARRALGRHRAPAAITVADP
jgi:hypothetical protein